MTTFRILVALLVFTCAPAFGQMTDPGIKPSAALVAGDCLQATGPYSAGTTGTPCGSGSGGITGPTSSTQNGVVAFSNTTGSAVEDTGILYSNLGQLSVSQTWTGANTYTGPSATTGAAGTFRGTFYQTGGVNRWGMGASVDPESGGNSGSSWVLQAYGDNGAVGVTAMTAARATGQVYFGVRPTFGVNTPWDGGNLPNPAVLIGNNTFVGTNSFSVRPTFNGATPWDSANLSSPLTTTAAASTYLPIANPTATGAMTVNGTWMTVSAASGTFERYTTNTLGSASYPTWEWGTDGTAQTGSNAGSNFGLWAMSDVGAALYEPISITRATGAIAFGSTPTAPTAAAGNNSTALATTAFVQTAFAGGGSSPTFANLGVTGTLSVAGISTFAGTGNFSNALNVNGAATFASAATFNYPIYSNFSFIGGSTSVMQVPVIQVTGTSNTQGIIDSGQIQVSGNAVIGATNGSTSMTSNGPFIARSTVQLMGYTVATLPAGNVGMTAYVTDAELCNLNTYVSGGGSLFCPVIFNGSGWVGG
jgi:hypothetical protein